MCVCVSLQQLTDLNFGNVDPSMAEKSLKPLSCHLPALTRQLLENTQEAEVLAPVDGQSNSFHHSLQFNAFHKGFDKHTWTFLATRVTFPRTPCHTNWHRLLRHPMPIQQEVGESRESNKFPRLRITTGHTCIAIGGFRVQFIMFIEGSNPRLHILPRQMRQQAVVPLQKSNKVSSTKE